MRNNFRFMMGIAAMAFSAASASLANAAGGLDPDGTFGPQRHKGKGQNNRRGKGKVNRPRKRSNRLTISKRVRNKHRKAARR